MSIDNSLGNCEGPVKGIVESADLELLGLTQQTERSLGTFQIICGGWNICNSWAGIVGTLAIGITEGGTLLLLCGIIIITVFGGCFASTLAELSSVYPTAGGQYHWTSILSPRKCSRFLVSDGGSRHPRHRTYNIMQSYCCGSMNVFSWIATSAGVTILPAQFIISMAIYNNPGYEPQTWHYFLI